MKKSVFSILQTLVGPYSKPLLILLSLRGVLFLSQPKTNTYVSVKKNINKELFESVLQSCSLITFNDGFHRDCKMNNEIVK